MAEEKPRKAHIGEKITSGSTPGTCWAVTLRSHHVLPLWSRRPPASNMPGTNPSDDFHGANPLEAKEATEGEGEILSRNLGH